MKPFTGTKAEHLAWAKQRALEYLDDHDVAPSTRAAKAAASFSSDMTKHDAWLSEALRIQIESVTAALDGPIAVRAWIASITP